MSTTTKEWTAESLPTNLKDLIAIAKGMGIAYNFEKKEKLAELILEKQGGSSSPAPVVSKEKDEVSSDTKASKTVVKKEVKSSPKEDNHSKKGKKGEGSSPEDIEALKQRKDVKAVLENANYKTSDKIRKLYYPGEGKEAQALNMGQISKVLGIHYSFTYCVVDTYRKNHLEGGKVKEEVAASKK